MKYTVTIAVEVDADCSRAALARVLGCMRNDIGEMDATVEPDDGDLDGEGTFASADLAGQEDEPIGRDEAVQVLRVMDRGLLPGATFGGSQMARLVGRVRAAIDAATAAHESLREACIAAAPGSEAEWRTNTDEAEE